MSKRAEFLLLAVVIGLAAGCDSSGPDPVITDLTVVGRVTNAIDDTPVPSASVALRRFGENAGFVAASTTDSNGDYEIHHSMDCEGVLMNVIPSATGYTAPIIVGGPGVQCDTAVQVMNLELIPTNN